MLNIMLSGCCGSMGRAVTAFADNRDDIKITAGIDREGRECKFPTFVSPFSFNGKVDVIIDFSSPAALPGLLGYQLHHAHRVCLNMRSAQKLRQSLRQRV